MNKKRKKLPSPSPSASSDEGSEYSPPSDVSPIAKKKKNRKVSEQPAKKNPPKKSKKKATTRKSPPKMERFCDRVEVDGQTLPWEERILSEVTNFKRQCISKGLDTSIFRYLQPKKLKPVDSNRIGIPFLCCHNKCGFLSQEYCDKGFNCCHHIFSIIPGSSYANNGFLRCCFKRAENANQSDDYPKIELNWAQYTDRTHVPDKNVSNGIKGFFHNTVIKHFECHKKSQRPTCLLLAKDA